MTRHIAIAILVTVWSMLAIGGGGAYWGVRGMLLEELDESLVARASALSGIARVEGGGSIVLPAEDRYIVRDASGRTLARPPEPGQAQPQISVKAKSFASLPAVGRMRSVTLQIAPPGGTEAYTVVYSGSAQRFDQTMNRLALILVGIGVASALATAVVAVAVSRRVMRPLRHAAAVIASIDERNLDQRIDSAAVPTELRPISERLNEMLERLELVFAQRKQFLADAAHELRTPVAALLTTLEVSARRPREAEAIAQTLQACLADARLLKRLTETLLEQARTESRAAASLEVIDVAALARQCVAALRPLAESKEIGLVLECPDPLRFKTRADALQSVLINLISNAIEYTPANGQVRVACAVGSHGALELEVADSGPGIREKDLPHLFEPFYRGDGARPHREGHLGLGLFLVRSHVVALGGTFKASNGATGGAVFQITLPAVPVGARHASPLVQGTESGACPAPTRHHEGSAA